MDTLARPYARAAFAVAQDTDPAGAEKGTGAGTETWLSFLSVIAKSVTEPTLATYVANPSLARKEKVGILLQLSEECGVKTDAKQSNFLTLLFQNNRLRFLPAILRLFREMKLSSEQALSARVRTAFPLDDAEREQLEKKLSAAYKRPVRAEVTLDESLIGGLVIEILGYSRDYSIKGKLEILRKNL